MLNILIGIDDTDTADSPGTGTVAENLAKELKGRDLAACAGISRHQLFVHDDIPYTSHNSAMCFYAVSHADRLHDIVAYGEDFLQRVSAAGSDPGLCVVVDDSPLDKDALIAFGRKAKQSVLDKQSAYGLAMMLGVHLSEHGGTGNGVIGALAATGLRLSGQDGRYRGWHRLGNAGETTTVAGLCSRDFVDAVVTEKGRRLADDAPVHIAEPLVKTVLMGGLRVVPVASVADGKQGPKWTTLTKKEVKRF